MQKIETLIDLEDMIETYKNKEQDEKHLKGYMFDSLVYRYQVARYSLADYEAKEKGKNISHEREYAKRDIMRFIQILDEAMGEHD